MPTKTLKPTITDVAEAAGCSVATVSRVMNGKDAVSHKMEQRIRDAVQQCSYVPIRKRKTRRTSGKGSILSHGAVTLLWSASRTMNLTGENLLQGLTDGLHAQGITLNLDYLDTSGRVPTSLESGLVDGFIIHGMPDEKILTLLRKHPVVWLFQQGSHLFGDRVQPDHVRAGELASEYFYEHGIKHVCCVTDSRNDAFAIAKARTCGFLEKSSTFKFKVDLIDGEAQNSSPTQGTETMALRRMANEAAKAFANLSPKPEAVFVANHLGPFLHMELAQLGIVPMRDVCLIAGNTSVCSQHHLFPEPITIRIFSEKIGKLGALRLRERIENPDLPESTTCVKPKLHIPSSEPISSPDG